MSDMQPSFKRGQETPNPISIFVKILIVGLLIIIFILAIVIGEENRPSENPQISTTPPIEEVVEKTVEKYIEEAPVEKTSQSAIYDEIITQAENYSVNRTIAVRLAGCESDFNTRSKNPNSTAKGVYQFLDGTWDWIGAEGHQFDYKENIKQFMIWYPVYPSWWSECIKIEKL